MSERYRYIQRRCHDILEMGVYGNRFGALFDWFMVVLILANLAVITLHTVEHMAAQYERYFHWFEVISVIIFTLEYVARIWVSVVGRTGQGRSHTKMRLNYMFTPMAVIDLLAIVPFYLTFLFPALDLRFMRIFRLMRMLKLVRYSPALVSLFRVIYEERRALIATLIIMLGLTFFAASAGYYLEHQAQPHAFGSIPRAMWWALSTLTTVGYGDVVPITVAGKILGGFVMIFGLALYAIPIGIIASAFSNEIHRRDFVVRFGLVAQVPLFEDLEPETISDISRLLRSIVVEDGAVISHRGQVADGLYFIVSGEAVAILEGRELVIRQGGFFGEISLMKNTFRDITLVAKGTCRLMLLESHDFQHLLTTQPNLRLKLYHLVQKRLAEISNFGFINAVEMGELLEGHIRTYGPFTDEAAEH